MRCLHRYPHILFALQTPSARLGQGGSRRRRPHSRRITEVGHRLCLAGGSRGQGEESVHPTRGQPWEGGGRALPGPCRAAPPQACPAPRWAVACTHRGGAYPPGAWGWCPSVGVWETLAQEAGPGGQGPSVWPEAQAGPTAPPAGLPVQRLQLGPSSLGPESLRVGPVQRSWGLGSGEWRSLGARSPTRPSEKASAESRPPSLASSDPRCCGDRLVVLSMLLVPEWPGFPYQPPPQDTGQEPLTPGQPEGSVRELGAPAPRGGSATCREGAPGSREA